MKLIDRMTFDLDPEYDDDTQTKKLTATFTVQAKALISRTHLETTINEKILLDHVKGQLHFEIASVIYGPLLEKINRLGIAIGKMSRSDYPQTTEANQLLNEIAQEIRDRV